MRRRGPVLVAWLLLAVVRAEDPFLVDLGAVDDAAGRDPDLVALVAPRVTSVDDKLPAKAMGLKVGDRLIALDGIIAIGATEWELVRYRHPTPDGLRIAVLRDYRIVHLQTDTVLPVRRVGFQFDHHLTEMTEALRRIGLAGPHDAVPVERFPPRAALALLRWHAHRQDGEPTAWIAELGLLFDDLIHQRWAAAAARPPVVVPDSAAALQRLARFYRALAMRHAAGEQDIDRSWHGERLLWFVIHYPYPVIRLPTPGDFTHPDPGFVEALSDIAALPSLQLLRRAAVDRLRPLDGEENYDFRVRQSVIDPLRHGGWPFRHQEVYEGKTRPALVARLRRQAASDDPQAVWSRYLALQAGFVDAAERGDGDALQAVSPEHADIARRSPLLGHLAVVTLMASARMWDRQERRDRFSAMLRANALPDAPTPSRFLAELRAHTADQSLLIVPADEPALLSQLDVVHAALLRTQPFLALHHRLRETAWTDRPVSERAAVVAELGGYVAGCAQRADLTAMARAEVPGAVLDALTRIAYAQAVRDRDVDWLIGANETLLGPGSEARNWRILHAGLGSLPWDDRERLPEAVEDLRLRSGSPQVTLVLAAACAGRGHQAIADGLHRRVERLFINLRHLAEHGGIGRGNRRWLDLLTVRVLGSQPQTVAPALLAMSRYLDGMREEDDWDSAWLEFARACVSARQRQEAFAWLERSLTATKRDQQARFIDDGRLHTAAAFRTVLLNRIIAQEALTPGERQRLIAAARADQVEPAFADLLGVAPAVLTGAAAQPGANDF